MSGTLGIRAATAGDVGAVLALWARARSAAGYVRDATIARFVRAL